MNIIQTLTFQHFQQMHALELLYYEPTFITPAKEAYKWYIQHPHSTIAKVNEDAIIGFINLFPVRDHVYAQLTSGTFNDAELTVDDIAALDGDEPLHMFLSCIVVHPDYRGQGVTEQLLQSAITQYEPIAARCVDITTDNVTAAGEGFSKRYGFSALQVSDHHSVIYVQSYADFIRHVNLRLENMKLM